MAGQYLIIVRNMAQQAMPFYAFQEQAAFTAAGSAPTVFSTCLASGFLAPQPSSGTQLDFAFDAQIYAGARSDNPNAAQVSKKATTARYASSRAYAVQSVSLARDDGAAVANCATMTVSPLALAAPVYQAGVPPGCFGIQVPSFTPAPVPQVFCGCAAINQDGTVALSSYIAPPPNSQVSCAPVAQYYVSVGSHAVGESIDYDTSFAARCDFTDGLSKINVAYNSDGSYVVTGIE